MGGQHENPPAFPLAATDACSYATDGMTLRDWFAGQVLPSLPDSYPEWQLKAWFGDRIGLTREEIRAKAAYAYADAMLAARTGAPA